MSYDPFYSAPYEENGMNPWLRRAVWLIGGFNLGFLVPSAVLFLLLPALSWGVSLRHPTVAPPTVPPPQVAFVVVTPEVSPPPPPLRASATSTELISTSAPLPPTEMPPPVPSATPIPTLTPLPPSATPLPAPVSYSVEGVRFQQQEWNNCGPSNLAMALSFYDWQGTQRDTAAYLKPNREDKNVSPEQMVAYVNENTNLRALYRVAGTLDVLYWLTANGFIVIAEAGYQPPGGEWYGHYFTVGGYDQNRGVLELYDSYLGRPATPRVTLSQREFDAKWQSFNRLYIVIYPPEREAELQAFLGRAWNMTANWRQAAEVAQAEIGAQPENAYVWFNLGAALTMTGDYGNAARAFDQAFNLGLPWRMLWYQFTPYEAYFQASRLEDVVALAKATLETTPFVEETYYYLGRVYEVWGDVAAATAEYQKALRYNRNFRAAAEALARLENT